MRLSSEMVICDVVYGVDPMGEGAPELVTPTCGEDTCSVCHECVCLKCAPQCRWKITGRHELWLPTPAEFALADAMWGQDPFEKVAEA